MMTPFLLAWEVLHALDRVWWGLVSDRGDGSFEQPPGPHARLSGTHDTVIVSGRFCQLEQKDQNAQLRDNPPYRLRHWRCRSPARRTAMGLDLTPKPPEPERPPSYLLIGILRGRPMCLDVVADPFLLNGEDYPGVGSMRLPREWHPPPDDGFYVVTFRCGTIGPDHNGEYDGVVRDTWRRLTPEEEEELAGNGFDDYLGMEAQEWLDFEGRGACGDCGKPLNEHPGWPMSWPPSEDAFRGCPQPDSSAIYREHDPDSGTAF